MWQIIESYEWDKIRRDFDWIRAMEGIPQDPVFHAEGNVDIHTRMVLEALQELEDFKSLSEQDQHVLLAAALLHDVEKRSTTLQNDDGRITHPGHARKGEMTSRMILYLDIPTPFPIREQIVRLVRYHGLPLWVFDKADPRKAVIEASLEVNTHHLAILAQADVLGRISDGMDDLLYRIELFHELCREYNCYGKAREFTDEFSRFFYLQREEVAPDYVAYDDSKFRVVLLSGLPGAGKDMYINFNLSDWPVVSPDDLRREMKIKPNDKAGNSKVMQRAKEKAKEYMRARKSFIWNGTNITRQVRQQLIDLFLTYGAFVTLVYVEVPYALLQLQNQNREQFIPPTAITGMLRKIEVPDLSEAHRVIYDIREMPIADDTVPSDEDVNME